MIRALLAAVMIVAHDPGYYTSLSKHLQRWLGSEHIEAEVIKPNEMPFKLAKTNIAFLLGFNEPSAAELDTLTRFVNKGGKLVVFHSASPKLGELMGVKPTGYKTAPKPGAWSRMDFVKTSPPGTPLQILQTSTVLQTAAPIPGQSRVIATWSDREGNPAKENAWLAGKRGYWMTHVLLADGDEVLKAQWVAAICGSLDPKLWNAQAAATRKQNLAAQLRAYATRQRSDPKEIRAVWDHSGCGLYPGNWQKTFAVLKNAHVTDLFVNVAGAGFAHYNSKVLRHSKTFQDEGDQLAACLRAAKGTGIRVHAWILCFTSTRGDVKSFQAKGWTLKNANTGKDTEYLDPANPQVRALVLNAISELKSYRVDGVHLDFVRYYEGAKKPSNASRIITSFVYEARKRVKHPQWLTTAVLGKYPACIASVGQDWESWLSTGIVDYVVPMDYTENMKQLESFLAQHAVMRSHAKRTICGIGVTANESRLDARGVMDQIKLARKYGMAGVALFDLDTYLEKNIFPYLRLGLW